MFFKSVQAGDFRLGLCVRKYLAFSNLPRMDSNHDKVIQSRFVRLRKRPRVFAALGKGPIRATFHTVVRFRVVELARTGGYTQCSKTSDTIDRNLRRNSLGLTLWKELPQFLERSAIVGDLIIGESNKVTRCGSTWRVRHGTAVILSGGSFA